MSQTRFITLRNLLVVAVITEVATGLALLLNPALVSSWLLGIAGTEVSNLFARCFGLGLLALGIACWPGTSSTAARWAMLFYNAVIAIYLAYLGLFVSSGLLLWPAVIFHIAMSLLLVRSR